MANKLLRLERIPNRWSVAVLDTPCFPARYYAGMVEQDTRGNYWTADNSTSNFHRTLEAANAALDADLARQAV